MSKHHVSSQTFLFFFSSRRACHHVKSKRATTYTDSAQRLPPPPPPQAPSCPWAVPNLLPSACRATAAAACTSSLSSFPLLPIQEAQSKDDRVQPLGTPTPALTWYLCKSGLANIIFTNETLCTY